MCPKGLAEVLENEIKNLGIPDTQKITTGVFFETNWEGCYKVNLHSRISSRVVKPILDFNAYNGDDLYNNVKKHDFTKYITTKQTLKVEASIKDCSIHDQRFLAMRVKDAIVDQFREKFEERPSVDNAHPDMRIVIHGIRDQYYMSLDTSGDALFMRGYRNMTGEAPMKENLAAGLLALSGWDRQSPIVDPMCGSGTILIEAALMAMNIAPGSLRKRFGFMNLQGFNKEAWDKIVDEALESEKQELDFMFYGSDSDRMVLKMAKDNARRAGVDHVIDFQYENVATVAPKTDRGMIITNPPYAIRLGDEENVRDVYRDLGFTLKHRFKGWSAWLLSGNKDLIQDLKLKSTRRIFTYNGPIECRFLEYKMF